KGNVSKQAEVLAGGRAAIQGTVTDEKRNEVAAVKVTARRRANGRVATAYSDPRGKFTIPDLAPGAYEVKFESNRHQTMSYRKLVLDAGERANIQANLDTRAFKPITLAVYGYRPMNGRFDMEEGRAVQELAVRGGARKAGALRNEPGDVAAGFALPASAPMEEKEKLQLMGQNKNDKDERDRQHAGEAGEAGPRVRSFFPETLYTNPALITDGQGRASIRVPMADSITTWRISSLASTTGGQLGSNTFPVKVFQGFFVDLDLPVSVTEGDSISVPVAVYNYLPERHQVSLDLRQDPWFALDGDQASKQVDVAAAEVTVAYFRIKAGKIGEQQLQVTARI